MNRLYDELNNPGRRKEDRGSTAAPGRRQEDVASRRPNNAPEFQAVIESGGTGITVHGHLILCVAPDGAEQSSLLSSLVHQLAENSED